MGLGASWFWPDVNRRKNPLFAIDEAFCVVLVVAAFTAVLAALDLARSGYLETSLEAFVNAALFAGTAFGIRQQSRIAALSGLVLYVLSRAYFWAIPGHGNLVIAPLVALALFHGVRGTFAYHQLLSLPPGRPSLEESFKAVASEHQRVEQKTEQE